MKSLTREPFWPRRSPHFATLRAAVRPVLQEHAGAVAVGLSGGPDSLALAAAVAAEARSLPGSAATPLAVVVDHGLQPGSDEVARTAAAQARAWGLDARVITLADTPLGPLPAGAGEAEARIARYRALATVGRPMLVAHTADDQAETLLLGALRGQVTGMAAASTVEGCEVLRPLLGLRRVDTEGACAELGVTPWCDPHNADPRYRRVRIRREVLPLLADVVGGDAVAALAQAASDAAADAEELETAPTDDCAELAALPAARRRRAIHAWLIANGVEATRAAIAGVDALCTAWHGQGGVAVRPADGAQNPGETGSRLEVRRVGGKLAVLTTR